MKNIQNPTTFFFEQANNPPDDYREEIDKFVSKLINLNSCILCKEDYNFQERMPRILIHCGHTLCTSCLTNFYKNQKVRCPLCLKLVKNIESLERLPVNHTIFIKMGQELNKQNVQNGQEEIDIQGALYAQFESSCQPKQQQYYPTQEEIQQQQQSGKPRIDEETGLEWCEKHYDRIKHFFCMAHYNTSCRICSEDFHSGDKCNLVDLYDLEDIQGFLENFTPENIKKMQKQNNSENKQQQNHGEDSEGGDDENDEDEEDDEDDDDDEEEDGEDQEELSNQSI